LLEHDLPKATVSELLAHNVIEASTGQLPPVEVTPREPEAVTIGVQINGKTIGTIVVPVDAPPEEALRVALADYRVANHVRDASVSVEEYKPGRILRLSTA
jgi:leucyl-tRNA synthetase